VLIFDEVMTGFRVALGGAQARYGVTPDLTTASARSSAAACPARRTAVAGHHAGASPRSGPSTRPARSAGTRSPWPPGLATLRYLAHEDPYPALEATSAALGDGIAALAARHGVPMVGNRVGSMFTGFFQPGEVFNYRRREAQRPRRVRRSSTARCWPAGSTSRRRSSRPASCRSPTTPPVVAHTLAAADEALAVRGPRGMRVTSDPSEPPIVERARWFQMTEAASVGIEIAAADRRRRRRSASTSQRNVTHWAPWTLYIGLGIGIGAAAYAVRPHRPQLHPRPRGRRSR
jgi:hypothetical protein